MSPLAVLRARRAARARRARLLRALLTLHANQIVPAPDGLERIRDHINSKTAAPAPPGTAARSAEPQRGNPAMTIVRRRPLTLRAGQIITRHPDAGTRGRWKVLSPPVLFGETAEIDVRDRDGRRLLFTADRHDRVAVSLRPRDLLVALLRAAADRLEARA